MTTLKNLLKEIKSDNLSDRRGSEILSIFFEQLFLSLKIDIDSEICVKKHNGRNFKKNKK